MTPLKSAHALRREHLPPNTGHEPLPEAGATQEQRREAVRSSAPHALVVQALIAQLRAPSRPSPIATLPYEQMQQLCTTRPVLLLLGSRHTVMRGALQHRESGVTRQPWVRCQYLLDGCAVSEFLLDQLDSLVSLVALHCPMGETAVAFPASSMDRAAPADMTAT
jgi:hypothetical protein